VSRIVIFCTDEATFQPPMFRRLIEMRGPEIVGAFLFAEPRASRLPASLRRVFAYDGWKAFPRLAWRALQAASARHPGAAEVFRRHGIEAQRFRNPNDPDCMRALRQLAPEVVLNNQPWYLKPPLLSMPGITFLNKHTGAIPSYRGVEPVFHALLDGVPAIGVVVHTMTPEIDAGDIVAERWVEPSRSVFDCYARAFSLGAALWDEAISNVVGKKVLRSVEANERDYRHWPTAGEISRFRKAGLRYL
jgi:folate-dependent phosphoribosylglycinamide formyltransferase PurN